MSDATGAGVATSKYSVDGASASLASEFGFTGQLWLPSVQLYYYKARMYSPQLGRFMQRDPLGYAAGLNLYAYAGGDPVNARDPSGLTWECINGGPMWIEPKPTHLPDLPEVMVSASQPRPTCSIPETAFGGITANPNQGGAGNGGGQGGGGPQGKPPCTGVAGAIQDFTGGQSNQSFVDDVVNNFVDTKDSGLNKLLETGSTMAGGGTVAGAWGGVTPLQAAVAAWKTYNSPVSIPGLIGFRTVPQILFTTGVTWATNTLLIKGVYNSGVLTGSILRTGVNRLASTTCGP